MQVSDLLERAGGRLTATERRLADVIAADPAQAAVSSVADLAAAAGTHGSSVVRLARKLGFSGFPEFRSALHNAAFVAQDPAIRLRERLDSLSEAGPLATVLQEEAAALAALQVRPGEAMVARAARVLAEADRVVTVGEGSAGTVAAFAADRLQRLGIPADAVAPSPRAAAHALAAGRSRPVLLAVAFVRRPPSLGPLLRAAGEQGSARVLLCDPGLETGVPALEVVLPVARGGASRGARTAVAPLAVITAILLGVSRMLGPRAMGAVERYGALRRALEARDE